jgi:hypothetical protein
MKYEWRKQEKNLYGVKQTPIIVEVPKQKFILIKGKGNPNETDFSDRISALYSVSYTIHEVSKNEIIGKNDLWLDPVRQGNHQIPIVSFADDKELLEKISFDRPKLILGDEVHYKDKDFTITRFDDMGGGLKTVTIKDNAEYLGGMITGSEVIPYRLESDLERLFGLEDKPKEKASNFKITEEILPEKLTPSERLNNNLEAISMLKRVSF